MRFLVDARLPPALARWLSSSGVEARHVADLGLLRAADGALWNLALADNLVIVTKDEEFRDAPPVSYADPGGPFGGLVAMRQPADQIPPRSLDCRLARDLRGASAWRAPSRDRVALKATPGVGLEVDCPCPPTRSLSIRAPGSRDRGTGAGGLAHGATHRRRVLSALSCSKIPRRGGTVLEVFSKKTRATPRRVIETCRRRLRSYDAASEGRT